MTDEQKNAFGFSGKSLLWDELCKILNALQEQEMFIAISQDTKGEDRIHSAGRADGVNLVLSTLNHYREEAKRLNGIV
jgi:hypothetical protein